MARKLLLGGLGLRLWLCVCAGAAALGLADVSPALTRVELYQATAPLSERSEGGCCYPGRYRLTHSYLSVAHAMLSDGVREVRQTLRAGFECNR